MRPSAVSALALVSAVIGGAAVLLIGAAAGWVGSGEDTVVVGPPSAPAGEAARTTPSPRATAPLAGSGFDPARIYRERSAGVVTVYALFGEHPGGRTAQGSGFVASGEGHVLTNAHVITDAGEGGPADSVRPATRLYVEFKDGERVRARVVGWDVFNDVGVLRLESDDHPLSPIPFGNSSRVVVGEPVAAIGSPFGEQNSLAVGVVSATRRSVPALTSDYHVVDAIQIDAPINRGNSGGPLLDARGLVIGINAQIRSESGNAEGVGFAIPINSARRSMEQLIERGSVAYAYVGISTEDLTPDLARHLGYAGKRGALVVAVNPGPARDAGLRGGTRDVSFNGRLLSAGGDVVVAIEGRPVRTGSDLIRIVTERLSPGQRATFTVLRGSKRLNIPIRLAERPADPPAD